MATLVQRALVVGSMVVLSLLTHAARAQHCHAPLTVDAGDYSYRPYVGFLVASYGGREGGGNYEGLYAGFAYRHPWWGAEVRVPAYRLKRADMGTTYGLGDVVVSASGTLLRRRDGEIALGVELPAMLPTGDADRELGMGHAMLMPNAWFALDLEPFVLRAQLGYGRVIGEEDMVHVHRGVARTPIVNPMNRSELEHALTMSLGLRRGTSVHVGWVGGVPIDDPHGVNRQILAVGAAARVDPVEVGFELQRPVAGDPFNLRLVLEARAMF